MVEVAVQQPLLPVPHKDEKRSNVPVSESAQHHEIRFHPHLGEYLKTKSFIIFIHIKKKQNKQKKTNSYVTAAAHEQMAIMHQQQQQMRAEMQRRHIQQQVNSAKTNLIIDNKAKVNYFHVGKRKSRP